MMCTQTCRRDGKCLCSIFSNVLYLNPTKGTWATQIAGEGLTNYFNSSGELDKSTEAIRKCVLVLPMRTLCIGLTGTVKLPHCLNKGLF